MCGLHAGAANLLQGLFQVFFAGARALRQIGLHAQARQGGFELVRGIGQKALLRDDGVFQALEQVVHRHHQGGHLHGYRLVVQGAQIIGFALADALFQLRQWFDATHQRQPHQQHRQRKQGKLGQHHALDDFGGQHRALFAGLGHLHQGGALALSIEPDPGVGHPHFQAAHFIVADVYFVTAAVGLIGLWQRQLAVTAQVLAQTAGHLVIHQISFVGAQQFAGWLWQAELNQFVRPQPDLLSQGLHVVDQRPVKRLVGQTLRHQPSQRQTDGPQQEQWREHPVQNFAKQRTLFAFENPHVPALGFHGLKGLQHGV